MAIVNNGTVNAIPNYKLPTGYTRPVISEFDDQSYTSETFVLSIAKSTVENADAVVTMTAIVDAITTSMDAKLANDYVATNTVDAFSILDELSNNYVNLKGDQDWLTNAVPSYLATTTLYVKIA